MLLMTCSGRSTRCCLLMWLSWTLGLAPEGWHPRFSATRRHYRYTVLNQTLRSPLERRYAHLVGQPLHLDLLQAAAEVLVGVHDFASFGRPMQDGETTVRCILSAGWQQDGNERGSARFIFDVVGNAFLRSMVRALVSRPAPGWVRRLEC